MRTNVNIKTNAEYDKNVGWSIKLTTSLIDSISFSSGACNTIFADPTMHSAHPNHPNEFNFSFKT
jgi:hypothetical protein